MRVEKLRLSTHVIELLREAVLSVPFLHLSSVAGVKKNFFELLLKRTLMHRDIGKVTGTGTWKSTFVLYEKINTFSLYLSN